MTVLRAVLTEKRACAQMTKFGLASICGYQTVCMRWALPRSCCVRMVQRRSQASSCHAHLLMPLVHGAAGLGRAAGAAQSADVRHECHLRCVLLPEHAPHTGAPQCLTASRAPRQHCAAGLTAVGGMVLLGGGLLPSTTAQGLAATAVLAVRLLLRLTSCAAPMLAFCIA